MITIDRKLPATTLAALLEELKMLTEGVVIGLGTDSSGTSIYTSDKATPELENTIIQAVTKWDSTQTTLEEKQLETLLGKVRTLQADVGDSKTAISAAADLAALKTQLVTLADQVQTLTKYVKRLGGL